MKLPVQSVNSTRINSTHLKIGAIYPAQTTRLMPALSKDLGFTLSPERPPT